MNFNEESRENAKWFGEKKSVFLSFITFLGDATLIGADFFFLFFKEWNKVTCNWQYQIQTDIKMWMF